MINYNLMIVLHFMIRYMFQKASVINLENNGVFFGIWRSEICFCCHIVRPVHPRDWGCTALGWRELVPLWSGPISPAHHIHSKLTHSSASRRCTHTSTRTKQQSHWEDAGLFRGCTSVHAWLCSLVQDLDSRQSLTVRGVTESCTAHIYVYVCVLSPLARLI